MSEQVTKAVIPAAGMGTRFLPASKAVPKELLPIVDTPAIEYVVAEAASVGARDILMITGRGKAALEEHFDRNAELERALEAKGDLERLAKVRRSTDLATIHYVRQGDPAGARARRAVRGRARRPGAVRRPARRRPDRPS